MSCARPSVVAPPPFKRAPHGRHARLRRALRGGAAPSNTPAVKNRGERTGRRVASAPPLGPRANSCFRLWVWPTEPPPTGCAREAAPPPGPHSGRATATPRA